MPREVQEKVFDICRDHLSAPGVAFISYNALPGWRLRGWARDLMLYGAKAAADPAEQVRRARDFLKLVADSPLLGSDAVAALARSELDLLGHLPDGHILHDFLERHNEPFYLSDFARRAADHELQYLGDAQYNGAGPESAPGLWPLGLVEPLGPGPAPGAPAGGGFAPAGAPGGTT